MYHLRRHKWFQHLTHLSPTHPLRTLTFDPQHLAPRIHHPRRVGRPRIPWAASSAQYAWQHYLNLHQHRPQPAPPFDPTTDSTTLLTHSAPIHSGPTLSPSAGPREPSPPFLAIYTDGSATPNRTSAGWGAVIVLHTDARPSPTHDTGLLLATLYGPVSTSPDQPRYFGAYQLTNNTGELSAIINALHWFQTQAPPHYNAYLFTDSQWSLNAALRVYSPTKNVLLAQAATNALQLVRLTRHATIAYVKAHSNFLWNEYADRMANLGRTGDSSYPAWPDLTHTHHRPLLQSPNFATLTPIFAPHFQPSCLSATPPSPHSPPATTPAFWPPPPLLPLPRPLRRGGEGRLK